MRRYMYEIENVNELSNLLNERLSVDELDVIMVKLGYLPNAINFDDNDIMEFIIENGFFYYNGVNLDKVVFYFVNYSNGYITITDVQKGEY